MFRAPHRLVFYPADDRLGISDSAPRVREGPRWRPPRFDDNLLDLNMGKSKQLVNSGRTLQILKQP